MAYLAGFFNFLSPLFQTLIKWMYNGIDNYGWTIILFTFLLKIITLPLDIWQKFAMKKTQMAQLEMAPDLAKINARYRNNKNELNQKTMQCYKQHGFSPVGGCLPIVINLIFIIFVYFSMFAAMNTVSAQITGEQFKSFEKVYNETVEKTQGVAEEKVKAGQNAVIELYKSDKSTQNRFLWIENIARKDSSTAPFPSASEYNAMVSDEYKRSEDNYNNVMNGLIGSYSRWNGYYILPILVIGVSILTTYITQWQEKRKSGIAAQQSNVLMKFLMPAIMGILCFRTAATFGIYLLGNSLITILTGFGVDPLVGYIIKKQQKKKQDNKPKIVYSR